ncbi:hypothetical protein BBBOND_0204180 [Babesia bigemina]|uniref:Uncharacterized protein n=1 Tax=Babesia bigemina TaxID=5866 RepID=A0A061DBX9_BABBI|nr:hypothetical protein BBBOND_0204180 [Babesia bigemina]CDR95260.1 hypothetical protein BBBOND_0204180 [Babesia bigemina]|eukprot:XP_012767446.1 hypothetical protein BBBOND_0204180 [Babesia bigemina]
MTSIRQYMRLNVAFAFCLYISTINCMAMVVPGRGDISNTATPPATGLALYAGNADFCRKIKILETLSQPDTQLCGYLNFMLLVMQNSNDSPKIKDENTNECHKIIQDLQNMNNAHVYFGEMKHLLNEYRGITRRLQRGRMTSERLEQLRSSLTNLEERFKIREDSASEIAKFDHAPYYRRLAKKAQYCIKKHTHRTPTEADDPRSSFIIFGNPPPVEADLQRRVGGLPTVLPQHIPASVAGNEKMRRLLNDGSLLITLGKVQSDVKKIEAIIHDPLLNDTNVCATDGSSHPRNAMILKIQDQYDGNCDSFTDVTNAWNIYRRYDDINDILKTMVRNSAQAVELIEEQRRLELAFEEYGTIVQNTYLGDIDRIASNMLYMLEKVGYSGETFRDVRSVKEDTPRALIHRVTPLPETNKENDSTSSAETVETIETRTASATTVTNGCSTQQLSDREVSDTANTVSDESIVGKAGRIHCHICKTKRATTSSGALKIGNTITRMMIATLKAPRLPVADRYWYHVLASTLFGNNAHSQCSNNIRESHALSQKYQLVSCLLRERPLSELRQVPVNPHIASLHLHQIFFVNCFYSNDLDYYVLLICQYYVIEVIPSRAECRCVTIKSIVLSTIQIESYYAN